MSDKTVSAPASAGGTTGTPLPGFHPLYEQVREGLLERLIDGSWAPGMLLPSEQKLALELNVSQGTVRKALDRMTADNLLVRRQGRGTYVAEPEDNRILFQFYRLTADKSPKGTADRLFPQSSIIERTKSKASPAEQAALSIDGRAFVWRITRVRDLRGTPILGETLVLPASRFPALDRLAVIPNNVYELYSRSFGITVSRVEEKLKAVLANDDDLRLTGCKPGTPLLQIDRRAHALDGSVVEWRLSRCLTENMHYLSELK
jgi:GntR family transcriptional regulator